MARNRLKQGPPRPPSIAELRAQLSAAEADAARRRESGATLDDELADKLGALHQQLRLAERNR